MKQTFFACAALIALAAPASAADLAARSPASYTKAPATVSPVTNWSGFYAGVTGGYGWSSDADTAKFKGGFGGGTLGYNWQGGSMLFGLEADAVGGAIKSSNPLAGVTFNDSVRAMGSVTGRLGYVANSALLYVKGGYAWANNRASAVTAAGNVDDSKTHSGWTIGGGAEYMFAPSWSVKAEYMYANFASANYFNNVVPGGLDSGTLKLHTVKAGVNYHFN